MNILDHERVISVELPTDTYRILIDVDYWENGDACYLASVMHAVNGAWREVYACCFATEEEAVAACHAWIASHRNIALQ